MPRTTTRNQLYQYLLENPNATTEELSKRFTLSGSTIRHHLQVLMEEGRVDVLENAKFGDRGRPFQRYRVTHKGEADLLALILSKMIDQRSSPQVLAESVAEGLLAKLKNPSNSGVNLTPKLIALVDSLTRMGYHARWEVRSPNPVVIFENCPFARIGNQQKLICAADVIMLSKALGRGIEQTRQFELDENGRHICRFSIQCSRVVG